MKFVKLGSVMAKLIAAGLLFTALSHFEFNGATGFLGRQLVWHHAFTNVLTQ